MQVSKGKEEVKREIIELKKDESLISNSLIPIDIKNNEFTKFIELYKIANDKLLKKLLLIKEEIKNLYGYDIINTITSRIKTPQSILSKMKKKQHELNYKNLVANIDDIAGIRIICPFKNDVFTIKNIINEIEDIRILEEKDYISNPKRSGYSAYHLIVEVPIEFRGKEIFIKVEIQIRTMTMDFWAIAEHKMRYKTDKKLSWIESKKLSLYAKIINLLENKVSNLYEKH